MKKTLKIALVGTLAALGMTSAAIAQQPTAQKPAMSAQEHQKMMSGSMKGHDGMMMNDPEMRKQMTQMMDNCNKMMNKMGSMATKK